MLPTGILQNIPLAQHTTLKVGGLAQYFASAKTEEELATLVKWAREQDHTITILGGGSNVLIGDVGLRGLVIRNEIKGIEYETTYEHFNKRKTGYIRAHVGGGVLLDTFIQDTIERGYWGLENLSAIPGTVGATPIQNVGAYGVDISMRCEAVEVMDMQTGKQETFSNEACAFGYRTSFFKTLRGKRYIVTRVHFRLSDTPNPQLEYRDLAHYFKHEAKTPSLESVRDAVIAIRKEKFPNWHEVGTAGSFFKNPIVPIEKFNELKKTYGEIPGYLMNDYEVKVSLGWILDHVLHKKGYTNGVVSLYKKQALVLVNEGKATSSDIQEFSKKIIDEVRKVTGIEVEVEVTYHVT